MIQGCLNGARPLSVPSLPVTPQAVAADAVAARRAGADCLHIHPRDVVGRESLACADVAAHLRAVRAAVPGMAVGISTGDWIRPRAGRLRDMRGWTERPDYVSVNLSEPVAPQVIALMTAMGIGIELGLASEADLDRLAGLEPPRALRALIEMPAGPAEEIAPVARRIFARLRGGVPILLHGFDDNAFAFVAMARELGCDTRIGLEDCVTLPDGRPATNADLVAEAARIQGART
ncbi:MAG: 3-keto-5-aminohexanoate cleavage protein [Paracoccus sp. (in: a-proteobacteria)]|uniref:3-keto-5-aminohexanoate cleavage protein n=1 Tax=Paracoccus sp. TaxID=267 RepID=UPI0039E6DB6E